MSTATAVTARGAEARPMVISRIAVGVDGRPEGDDAAVLASSIARLTHADLVLVGVHPEPLVVLSESSSVSTVTSSLFARAATRRMAA